MFQYDNHYFTNTDMCSGHIHNTSNKTFKHKLYICIVTTTCTTYSRSQLSTSTTVTTVHSRNIAFKEHTTADIRMSRESN